METSIFSAPPLDSILLSVFQTATLFVFLLLGLKLVGRRVFGEQSPQDLILLLIIAEACNQGLTDEQAGYWGAVASILTILFLGWLCDRIPSLRKLLDDKAVLLFKNGILKQDAMKKHMIDVEELDLAAREYGLQSHRDFKIMMLEGDGKITGVIERPRRKLD